MLKKTERKPRVAMYMSSMTRGGAEHVMANLAEHFAMNGYDVSLVTTHKGKDEYDLLEQNVAEYSKNEKVTSDGIRYVNISSSLTRYYSEIDNPEKGGRISNFNKRCKKLTRIWEITNPDVILSFIGKNNMMAVKTSREMHIPTAVSIRANPTLEYPNIQMKLAAEHYYRKASLVIAQCESVRSFFSSAVSNKMVVLKNPVGRRFLETELTMEREKVVVSVGRLYENKRPEMLIDAFAAVLDKIPEYRLVLYGEGELRNQLIQKVKQMRMEERICLPGSTDDIASVLEKSSIYALTSDSEGMPNALIEAMCMGNACISTDCPCGGPRTLIKDKINGLLIPVGDQNALEQALLDTAGNETERKRLAQQALLIREDYNTEKVYDEWEKQLTALMRK